MALGGFNKDIVSRWTLDGSDFKKSMTEMKAKVDLFREGVKAVAGALDSAFTSGLKYSNFTKNLTINIDAAQEATGGLIDKMSLMAAASRAQAFQLGLNTKQFADVSRAATIAAQKMGIESSQAIGDIITGIARQSPMILDNLGIVLKVSEAQTSYAKTLKKSASALTDSEKRTAFMTEALKKLNQIAGDGNIEVTNLGSAWAKAKVTLKDFGDALAGAIANLGGGKGEESGLVSALKTATDFLRVFAGGEDSMTVKSEQRMLSFIATLKMAAEWARKNMSLGLTEGLISDKVKDKALGGGFYGQAMRGGGAYAGQLRALQRAQTRDAVKGTPLDPEWWKVPPKASGGAKRKKQTGANDWRETDDLKAVQDADALFREAREKIRLRDIEIKQAKTLEKIRNQQRRADADATFREQNATRALRAHRRELEALAKIERERWEGMRSVGVGALREMTVATVDAAFAAINGGASFGEAMQTILKSTIEMVGKKSIVKALEATAEGLMALAFGDMRAAGKFFASAATWGAVGVAASAVGLSIPSVGASGGGASGLAGAGPGASASTSRSERERERRPVVVQVRYDRDDPSSVRLAQRKITGQIMRSA